MNNHEVRRFVDDVCDTLPALSEYIDKTTDGGELMLRAWSRGLQDVDIKDATEVAIGIAVGDIQLGSFWTWQDFPALVRRECRAMRYQMSKEARQKAAAQRDSTYACPYCRDTGLVIVYHPGWTRSYVLYASCRDRLKRCAPDNTEALADEYKAWRNGAVAKGHRLSRTMAVACTCGLGNRHTARNPELLVYDKSRAAVARTGQPRDITAWLDARNEVQEWCADDWA